MHVANIKPTKQWTKLEDLITAAIKETATLKDNTYYTLYNNGGSPVQVITQNDIPTGLTGEGRMVHPKELYNYKTGTNDCYIKCSGTCDLHVEEVE